MTLAAIVLLLFSPFLLAAAPPQEGGRFQTTGGDSPLTTAYTWQGHGDALVFPLAFPGNSSVSGTFDVSGIPSGSTIIKAYYALTGWQNGVVNASGTFAGNNLGSIAPTVYDQGGSYYLCFYRWDVTSYVTGNGSYSFSGSSLNYCYVVYLVVVYENPSSPEVTIVINDGAESLQYASSTSLFSGFGPGVGTIKIVTQAGDDGTGTAEMIEFNGEILAGPGDIFVGNLGPVADYHEFDLTNIESDNSLIITVDADWIGIHLAVLVGGPGPDATMSCETLTPMFCRGKKFYFKLTVSNNTEDNISGTLTFSGYAGHDCDPANLLIGIPRYKTYAPGTTEQYYMFKVPSGAGPGLYSASVGGTLAGVDLFCCMNTEVISCEPWRIGEGTEWELVEVDRPEVLPAVTSLAQNYPNPFNANTNISFNLAEAGNVSLNVYDITGRLVVTLVDGQMDAGEHVVAWDASNVVHEPAEVIPF